ncbi:hypothetical protein [Silicimonas sp. MF1-12-2]|uniref:hypothetical protein n=1 Tax=Silicimonas sp. MF1-12-2 TaxID=3384793 RepID=UPI0039B4E850
MMGPRQLAQGALFYEFSIEDHVPPDHLLRTMDRFVDLGDALSSKGTSAGLTGGLLSP